MSAGQRLSSAPYFQLCRSFCILVFRPFFTNAMPHPAPPSLPSLPTGSSAYVSLAVVVAVFAGYWNIFLKAGRKGWESLVPGWNVVVLMVIVGRPRWWAFGFAAGPLGLWSAWLRVADSGQKIWWLMALPGLFVTGWLHYRVSRDLAKSFKCSRQFATRLVWLPFIYVPWLGFGYSEYKSPGALMPGRRRSKGKQAGE
jgi:hypothetical protein